MSTGSGTGTPAIVPSAVTAADLIAAIRVSLDDAAAAEFTDDELLAFLNEAIREYSQHLPRTGEVIIAAVAGETRYPLPWNATAVTGVSYPTGGDSGEWLLRRGRRSGRRAAQVAGGRTYELAWTADATRAPVLLLDFAPEPGATLTARYTHPHDSDLALNDALTVPAEHHHVLGQYVLFAAARQLQAREQAAPTNGSNLLMAQLAANARRLELAWLNALNRILFQRLGEGEIVSWGEM